MGSERVKRGGTKSSLMDWMRVANCFLVLFMVEEVSITKYMSTGKLSAGWK